MMSCKSKLRVLNLSNQVLRNDFIDKQKKIVMFSFEVVENFPEKIAVSVWKTFHSIFSILFWRKCWITWRRKNFKGKSITNNNYHVLSIHLGYFESFFDISCVFWGCVRRFHNAR